MPLTTNAVLFARASLALIFLWFGVMNFTAVGAANMQAWIGGHAALSGLVGQAGSAATAIGIYQIVMAALIGAPIPSGSFRRIGFIMLGAYCAIALSVLITNPVWMRPPTAEMVERVGAGLFRPDGFPSLGSGQGIIKYIAVLGLAYWGASFDTSRLFSQREGAAREWGRHIMWGGVFLVLLWIGIMKFTTPEAAGIEPLIGSHIAFSWMQGLMGPLHVSYVIGIVELITAAALLGYWFNDRLYMIGLFASAVTFLLTLSFLVSFAPAWTGDMGGFPWLSVPGGHFLLKDLALLAACVALYAERREAGYR